MKKFIFALLGLVLLSGCKTSQKVVSIQQPESQQLDTEKPIPWKQELYPKLAVGDKIYFFNSTEIVLEGDLFKQFFFLNGAINRIDSILEVVKTVPSLTQGVVIQIERANTGKIVYMVISYSRNDATYKFVFNLKTDGAFTLNKNAKLFFQGKENKVQATADPECILLVIYNHKEEKQTIKESAEGEFLPPTINH